MSVAVEASHFNIVERIDDDDDCGDDDDGDYAAAAAAASAVMMIWMTMPLPLIRPGLSYYCANRVHRQCQYLSLTEADTDQLDSLVHQLMDMKRISHSLHVCFCNVASMKIFRC